MAILPYIEEGQLYQQFKLDEPWDSPHNKKLIALMPKIYATTIWPNFPNRDAYFSVTVISTNPAKLSGSRIWRARLNGLLIIPRAFIQVQWLANWRPPSKRAVG